MKRYHGGVRILNTIYECDDYIHRFIRLASLQSPDSRSCCSVNAPHYISETNLAFQNLTTNPTPSTTMPTRVAVKTDKAPPPLPFFSQAIICNGMVYCSGSIGVSPTTKALVEGGVGERTVSNDR